MPNSLQGRRSNAREPRGCLTFDECSKCVAVLFKAIRDLQEAGVDVGMSTEDALTWSSRCLDLKIDKSQADKLTLPNLWIICVNQRIVLFGTAKPHAPLR